MDLLLVRCADLETESAANAREVSGAELADPFNAALSERGERHSRRLAAWLRGHAPRQLKIFSSPAKGARQMADLLAAGIWSDGEGDSGEGENVELAGVNGLSHKAPTRKMLGYVGEPLRAPVISRLLGPTARASDVLGAVGWPHDHSAALVVAHQPALGALASLLLSGQEAQMAVKKGAIWWFSSRNRGEQSQTVLRCVLTPDLIKGSDRSPKKLNSARHPVAVEQAAPVASPKVFRLVFPEVVDLVRLRLLGAGGVA